ncbi:MAG: AmmeMemoRadiSam system protein A [Chloroflexi bacterium]|nr:AmmeMemoRadiSam system protein A [Chloroflexota bacterium]
MAESLHVSLARAAVNAQARAERLHMPFDRVPGALQQPAACFVSIHKHGRLRGCIGTIHPTEATLAQEIVRNAVLASTEDPRFMPVGADELPDLDYSVDVLSEPEPIASADQLDPKRYGVIVRCGRRRGLLLPDLEDVDSVATQVSIALDKGGIGHDEAYQLFRFTVSRFH